MVSELQSDVTISGGVISGTLPYVTGYTEFSGNPEQQEGNYLVLKVANVGTATSVKIGVKPSAYGLDPVEIVGDPDMNIVLKITDAATQKVVIVTSDGENTRTETLSLIGLTCLSE